MLEPSEILKIYSKYNIQNLSIDYLNQENKMDTFKLNNINEEYRKIYEILQEPLSINEISEIAEIDITEVYSKLFMMEIEGLVMQKGNKYQAI